jgi:hypothetical protein
MNRAGIEAARKPPFSVFGSDGFDALPRQPDETLDVSEKQHGGSPRSDLSSLVGDRD